VAQVCTPAVKCTSVRTLIAILLLALQQVPVFRTGVDLVQLGVTVSDRKGALVADLTAADFEIYEDGKKQTIQLFASGREEAKAPPLHLGLMLDVSESMGEDMTFTKTAAVKFVNTLTDAEDITVVDFDTEVRAARYSQREFVRVIERIRQKKASGETALYDAIGLYLDGASQQDGRKIMLLYTDGGDNKSSMNRTELFDLLKASDATVYVIGELEHQLSSGRMTQRAVLQQIAELTGGVAFFPSAVKELDAMYDKVVAEIRAQYTIGYVSTNPKPDGTWRKVEVKVKPNGLKTRSRKGYFAPARKPQH